MTLRFFIVNLLLGIMIITVSVKTYHVWRLDEAMPLSSAREKNNKPAAVIPGRDRNSLPEETYDVIVEKDLFSKDRSEAVPEKNAEAPVVESKIQGKNITLFGVILGGKLKKALITNPETGKDKSKYLWIKEGQKIGGIKVVGIEKDSIVLKDNTQKYKILIHDKKEDKTNKSSQSGTKESEKEETVRTIVTESNNIEKSKTSGQEKQKTVAPQEEFETINTPFGEMKVRKK